MENKCTGLCCAAFFIYRTNQDQKDTIAELYASDDPSNIYIAKMLIPLTETEVKERMLKFGGTVPEHVEMKQGQWFTCHHWDENTRLCKDYENRQNVCRDYPTLDYPVCEYGCSLEYRKEPDAFPA